MILPNIKKIAVLRANGVGDFTFALPALWALRRAYRGAEIVLLGLDWHASFLKERPGPVDRVVVVPVSRGIREERGRQEDPGELKAFFDRMQQESFDLAVQLHGGGRNSNPFTLKLKARTSIGLKTPDAVPLDMWVPYIYFQHEVMRYLEVVSLVSGPPVLEEPRIVVTEKDLAEALPYLRDERPLVVIHPGAGDGRRRWSVRKFAAVGDALLALGARGVVIGGEQDQGLTEEVARRLDWRVENLCGKLSLGGLAGLLSMSSLVVGNDSGPLHLALAVGTPAVGIYWCGNVITSGPFMRTHHRVILSWELNCPVCGTNCITGWCDHHESFVDSITVEEVAAQATELLKQKRNTGSRTAPHPAAGGYPAGRGGREREGMFS